MLLSTALALSTLSGCTATDGDSLNCNGERIRLLGIDAPELKGCPRNRNCAPGNGREAKLYMANLIAGRSLTIERVGVDRYERTLAVVYADGLNISCAMIAAGHAIYKPQWDNDGLVARDC